MASVIAAIVYFCEAKAEVDRLLSEDNDTQFRFGLELSLFIGAFFNIGALGAELSFIRSVYKMLTYKLNKWCRICYIISAFIAALAVAFYCLSVLKIFNFVSDTGGDYTADIYLFTLWPSFIVSFILGSIPTGYHQNIVDQNSNNRVKWRWLKWLVS